MGRGVAEFGYFGDWFVLWCCDERKEDHDVSLQ